MGNYIYYKVRDEITYPFPNVNGATVYVWEWTSNFILLSTGHVIANPCWDDKGKSTLYNGDVMPWTDPFYKGEVMWGFDVFFVVDLDTRCRANVWVVGYSKRHDAHVASLLWQITQQTTN